MVPAISRERPAPVPPYQTRVVTPMVCCVGRLSSASEAARYRQPPTGLSARVMVRELVCRADTYTAQLSFAKSDDDRGAARKPVS